MKYNVKDLTLEEKLRMLTGADHWKLSDANGKLPQLIMVDGPHGLRYKDFKTNTTPPATSMPNLSLLANTWDPELAFLDGATIADECIEHDVDVLLAPGVNMKRTPMCGRNFEYFSEDPFLAGEMAKAYIEGVQSKGIGTSLKHFCLNNREHDRHGISSEVDERALREIYLPAFEKALEAKPWTVMCSYNPIDGVWASENKFLLKDVLRDELGFDGVIVSDWTAVHHSARAVKATLDLEMPYRAVAYEELSAAYERGYLTEEEIDERVTKILELIEKAQNDRKVVTTTKQQRHDNGVKIAKEGMVLLKNEDNILPLKGGRIMVTGQNNFDPALGGRGSARVTTDYKVAPLHENLAEAMGERANVYIPNSLFRMDATMSSARNMRASVEDAYDADTVVICAGSGKAEAEGFDRFDLRLPPLQEDLIREISAVNPNVVVVLYAGSAIDMSAWIDGVKGVLLAGFAGEGVQEAVAELLCGKSSPCGKLNETMPICIEDTPSGLSHGTSFVETYDEGMFIGYRWYQKTKKPVRYPFGYGLSYAQFEYSDLSIEKKGETEYTVSFTLTNTSSVDAKEISQLYVRDVFSCVTRPDRELKGFAKTELRAGESKRVSIDLNARSFAFWSKSLKKWHIENGIFEIMVGTSSQDIRLMGKIDIQLPEDEQYTIHWANSRVH